MKNKVKLNVGNILIKETVFKIYPSKRINHTLNRRKLIP